MSHRFYYLRHSFGDISLQKKFMLTLLVTAALPVLITGILISRSLYDMITADTLRKEQTALSDAVPEIENLLAAFERGIDELEEQDFYRDIFLMPLNGDLDELSSSPEAADFTVFADSLCRQNGFSKIRFYLDLPEDKVSLFKNDITKDLFVPASRILGTYWHGILSATDMKELYCPPAYLGIRERQECGDISYVRPTTIYYEGESHPAYQVIYYPQGIFREALIRHLESDKSVSYIINERSNLVVSTNDSLSGIYYLNYDVIEDSVLSSNSFIERQVVDESVYAAFYRIGKAGWFLVTVLPSSQLVKQSNQTMGSFILTALLFLFIILFTCALLVRSVTQRIGAVAAQMEKVRYGPPEPMESPEYLDEIGDLTDNYNYMARRMNYLLETQAQASEDLRIAEFRSLQAQINPHFLYNTMDMIHWMAVQGETEQIGDAVQKLSRFYRLSLNQKGTLSTIAQEEEHISIYIDLQNMRFGGKIDYLADIPEELLSCSIPRLTLQPVVENAILHGILEKEDKTGSIVLTGWKEDADVVLLVSDDGVGIPPEKLAEILSGNIRDGKGTNIAVCNTHRRLEILYGKGYGLSYKSELGKGTEVQIRIPDSQQKRELPQQTAKDRMRTENL